jgi:hypothetical protein
MDILVDSFLTLIKKVESITNSQIKIVAFDFDCTLIPFHTGGAYQIYDSDGNLKQNILDEFFPEADWIRILIITLVEMNIIPAIVSHSDKRFVPRNSIGTRGGIELIQPLISELIPGDIFQNDNIIAYSDPNDGSFEHKNHHINELVTRLNKKLNTSYNLSNVLLIDDTFDNIFKSIGYQCIYSDYKTTRLSFGAPLKDLSRYIEQLSNQLDQQQNTPDGKSYGLTFLPYSEIDKNTNKDNYHLNELHSDINETSSIFSNKYLKENWFYIMPLVGLAIGAKLYWNKN